MAELCLDGYPDEEESRSFLCVRREKAESTCGLAGPIESVRGSDLEEN